MPQQRRPPQPFEYPVDTFVQLLSMLLIHCVRMGVRVRMWVVVLVVVNFICAW